MQIHLRYAKKGLEYNLFATVNFHGQNHAPQHYTANVFYDDYVIQYNGTNIVIKEKEDVLNFTDIGRI